MKFFRPLGASIVGVEPLIDLWMRVGDDRAMFLRKSGEWGIPRFTVWRDWEEWGSITYEELSPELQEKIWEGLFL